MNEPTSESLAAIIVTYRSLNLFKDNARDAMIELLKRKDKGDTFDFESYIEEKLKAIPKPNNEVSKALSFISNIGSVGNLERK